MKYSSSAERCVTRSLGILVLSLLAGLLSSFWASGQTAAPPPAIPAPTASQPNSQTLSDKEREDFRTSMSRIPLPSKGCFTAQYPNKTWVEVQCQPGPVYPYPLAKGARRTYVGHGTGFFARFNTGNISSAIGSFDSITGVTTEYGSRGNNLTTVYPNTYTLQINSNLFPSALCGGASQCFGWQQFIFSQSGCTPIPTACTELSLESW